MGTLKKALWETGVLKSGIGLKNPISKNLEIKY